LRLKLAPQDPWELYINGQQWLLWLGSTVSTLLATQGNVTAFQPLGKGDRASLLYWMALGKAEWGVEIHQRRLIAWNSITACIYSIAKTLSQTLLSVLFLHLI